MTKEQKWTVAVSEWYFLFIQTRAVCFFWKKCILPRYFGHITAKKSAQLHLGFLFSGTADEIVAWSSVLGVSSAGHCSLWSCIQFSVCLWVLFATGLRSVLHLGQNQKAELGWCTVLLKWCFRLKLFLHPWFQELNQVGAAGCFRNCCRNMNTYRAAAGTGSCQSPVLSAFNMQLAERAVGSLLPLCSLFASRCCIGPGCSRQHQALCCTCRALARSGAGAVLGSCHLGLLSSWRMSLKWGLCSWCRLVCMKRFTNLPIPVLLKRKPSRRPEKRCIGWGISGAVLAACPR